MIFTYDPHSAWVDWEAFYRDYILASTGHHGTDIASFAWEIDCELCGFTSRRRVGYKDKAILIKNSIKVSKRQPDEYGEHALPALDLKFIVDYPRSYTVFRCHNDECGQCIRAMLTGITECVKIKGWIPPADPRNRYAEAGPVVR